MISAVNSKPLYNTSTGGTTNTGSSTNGPTSASAPGGAMGKDQFMKLLIAQMQNQDPMNPMQGDQMAAQLAQFSSLEQLQQINDTLTGQASSSGTLLGAIQANAAIGTIGHRVVASGNQVELGGTNGATSVTVDVANAGATATVKILDANGKVVGTRDLGALNGGRQTIDIGSAGDGLSGDYTYALDVKDAAGSPVTVQTYVTGRVDGISTGQNGLVLNLGKLAIPYASVVQVLN